MPGLVPALELTVDRLDQMMATVILLGMLLVISISRRRPVAAIAVPTTVRWQLGPITLAQADTRPVAVV